MRGRGERVIGLEFLHRPDDDAHGAQRLFERLKLRQQLGLDSLARLVSGPEIVAKRFDHVIGRDAQVRGAALQHAEDRSQNADERGRFPAVLVRLSWHRIEMPEQLVRAVEEVNSQALRCPNKSARTPGSRSFHTTPSVK